MDFSLYIWALDDTSKFTEDKLLLLHKTNQGSLDLVCLVKVSLDPACGQSPPGPLELFTLLISESSFLLAVACANQVSPVRNPGGCSSAFLNELYQHIPKLTASPSGEEPPKAYSKSCPDNFPGGPVAKAPLSQCRGPGFNVWSGNWIPHATANGSYSTTKTQCSQIKK